MPTIEELKKRTTYVDRHDLSETFVDSFENATFDGLTFRLELSIIRWDMPKPPNPPSGTRLPACRLVMAPPTVVELYNQLSKVVAIMEEKGLVKTERPAPKNVQ